jgi:hypothetical protein
MQALAEHGSVELVDVLLVPYQEPVSNRGGLIRRCRDLRRLRYIPDRITILKADTTLSADMDENRQPGSSSGS